MFVKSISKFLVFFQDFIQYEFGRMAVGRGIFWMVFWLQIPSIKCGTIIVYISKGRWMDYFVKLLQWHNLPHFVLDLNASCLDSYTRFFKPELPRVKTSTLLWIKVGMLCQFVGILYLNWRPEKLFKPRELLNIMLYNMASRCHITMQTMESMQTMEFLTPHLVKIVLPMPLLCLLTRFSPRWIAPPCKSHLMPTMIIVQTIRKNFHWYFHLGWWNNHMFGTVDLGAMPQLHDSCYDSLHLS